ncbi:MAG: dTDP-glucose 4,6-dehydratase [Clostridiales Family XIII bacterium]|jgi:dTDP-glucose 4,6-dehydratase|nr:dTDP-glucose 4,6-dehydratase [Clostridiales Family XIII bacterium]
MKQLVTGGAGFIGANYIHYILEARADARVVCLDALTYAGNYKTLASALGSGRLSFVKGDIRDAALVDELFRGDSFDAVLNFAAESHVDRSIDDPGLFLDTNILGVRTLMDACRKYGTGRFHQVSTDEVYGDLPLDRPDMRFTEATPLRASSPYSASKASADLLALAYHRTYGLPVTISRCSNNYGPYQFPEKLIPLMIINAVGGKSLPVYGKGENVRDWVHVNDHSRAIDAIVTRGRPGEVYNIGGGSEMANIDVVRMIIEKLGKDSGLIRHIADRPGHDKRYAVDFGKIKAELGWEPQVGFEDGLSGVIDWYLANEPWWSEIISGAYKDYYDGMYGARLAAGTGEAAGRAGLR